jgi:excisionase family DNA binding protein
MQDRVAVVGPAIAGADVERVSAPIVWLLASEAAERARVRVRTIYREVKAGRLKAARVGFRRELRFKAEWVDAWLEASAKPVLVEVSRSRQGAA